MGDQFFTIKSQKGLDQYVVRSIPMSRFHVQTLAVMKIGNLQSEEDLKKVSHIQTCMLPLIGTARTIV